MRKKQLFPLVILCLALGIATSSVGCAEKSFQDKFPQWEKVSKSMPINSDVQLLFLGVDFETYESEQGDIFYDEVLIKLKNRSTEPVTKIQAYRIEFMYEGEWYIVFSQSEVATYSMPYRTEEEVEISFLVPAGLFDTPGEYRLYCWNVGYCYIDILFNPYEAASEINLN